MSTVNLHIYQSSFTHESRILKETKSIVEMGLAEKVLIAAVWEEGLESYETLDENREVYRFPMGGVPLSMGKLARAMNLVLWMFRAFKHFIRMDIVLVSCRSLVVLPLGILFKICRGADVIYDIHELETEKDGWRGISQRIGKLLERALIHQVESVVVVSPSIAQWYRDTYALTDVYTIRNVPYMDRYEVEETDLLREKFGIGKEEVLFIFQGSFSYGRGVELLLDVFMEVDKNKHIVFMGYGELEDRIRELGERFDHIHYQPAVKPEEIPLYTGSADVGFNLAEPTCINHLFSLPNKVFEYLGSGIPVIVSDFPDMGELIDEYECGWKTAVDKDAVVQLVNSIARKEVDEKKHNVRTCREHFHWPDEVRVLKQAYAVAFKH